MTRAIPFKDIYKLNMFNNGCTKICRRFIGLGDKILFALAKLQGIIPSSLFVTGINKIGDHPIGGSGFADVGEGGYLKSVMVLMVWMLL